MGGDMAAEDEGVLQNCSDPASLCAGGGIDIGTGGGGDRVDIGMWSMVEGG